MSASVGRGRDARAPRRPDLPGLAYRIAHVRSSRNSERRCGVRESASWGRCGRPLDRLTRSRTTLRSAVMCTGHERLRDPQRTWCPENRRLADAKEAVPSTRGPDLAVMFSSHLPNPFAEGCQKMITETRGTDVHGVPRYKELRVAVLGRQARWRSLARQESPPWSSGPPWISVVQLYAEQQNPVLGGAFFTRAKHLADVRMGDPSRTHQLGTCTREVLLQCASTCSLEIGVLAHHATRKTSPEWS